MLRAYAAGVFTGSLLTAAAMLWASPAHADPDRATLAYADVFADAVCQTLDDYPTQVGVQGVMDAIHDDGLTWRQSGYVIVLAVTQVCPRHTALLESYARRPA